MNDHQLCLFDIGTQWEDAWQGMPEYKSTDITSKDHLTVHFTHENAREEFARACGVNVTQNTQYVKFPDAAVEHTTHLRYESSVNVKTRYPIYVISKGRWESRLTQKALESMEADYHVVIEPQEFDQYASVIDEKRLITLPFSNLGQGSVPARNFVLDHAREREHDRHWIMDDNIRDFYRLNNNSLIRVGDVAILAAAEDFVDRFINVPVSGFEYKMFALRKRIKPPFAVNRRIYSCILLANNVKHRWRGKYNEDSDLSLRVLKDGDCTILFNTFLAEKIKTMTMKGGNTEELYANDGRKLMAESLALQHPDVASVGERFGRIHHVVDYSSFASNQLKLRSGCNVKQSVNNYGMKIVNKEIK